MNKKGINIIKGLLRRKGRGVNDPPLPLTLKTKNGKLSVDIIKAKMMGFKVPATSTKLAKKRDDRRPKNHKKRKRNRTKRQRKKKKIVPLPNALVILENPDKTWHEQWTVKRGILNFPHPTRIVLAGPPNRGKTNVIKNLILHQNPPFEKIIVVHISPEFTHEYDDLMDSDDVFKMVGAIPPFKEFTDGLKTLVILEDLNFKGMKPDQKFRINRLFGNWSTHNGISVYATTQDWFAMHPDVKRLSNVFILWEGVDRRSMSQIALKVGLTADHLKRLFSLTKVKFDSIWMDLTAGSPFPLRMNGFQIIPQIPPPLPTSPTS